MRQPIRVQVLIGLLVLLSLLALLALPGATVSDVARASEATPTPAAAFYVPPADVPEEPGILLRGEIFTGDLPPRTRGWRILYTTTREDGTATVASGVVLAAATPPDGPQPVIAWAHGTTGIAERCAASLQPEQFDPGTALHRATHEGWVVVASDYPGLGVPGPHPFLIGEDQGRAILDAVRAARQLDVLTLSEEVVIWGYSQGGHAALWTGIIAPAYAPEIAVSGVAALAPVTDLIALLQRLQDSPLGQSAPAIVATAYSEFYADVRLEEIIRPEARAVVDEIAAICLAGTENLQLLAAIQRIPPEGVLAVEVDSGAFGARLRQNSVTGRIAAPLFVAQGGSDPLIALEETNAFVADRCANGQTLEYRTYAGRDHLQLFAPDSPMNLDLISWTEARIAGTPPPPGCQTIAG